MKIQKANRTGVVIMILLIIAAVSISGCSKKATNSDDVDAKIGGTWKFNSCSSGISADNLEGATVEFGTGSSFKFVSPGWYYQESGEQFDAIESGTYNVSGNKLTINITSQQPQGFPHFTFQPGSNMLNLSLNSNELKLSGGGGYTIWQK